MHTSRASVADPTAVTGAAPAAMVRVSGRRARPEATDRHSAAADDAAGRAVVRGVGGERRACGEVNDPRDGFVARARMRE